jgi:hypothetical protein
MTTPVTPPVSAFDCDFHFMVVLAELWGLEGLDAFILAAQMKASGLDAGRAQRLFRDAMRRIQ